VLPDDGTDKFPDIVTNQYPNIAATELLYVL
jgi:hypothetical protein